MFWTTAAYAMGAAGQGQEGAAGGIIGFAPIIIMFAVFYFLLIRPQQKKAKEHKNLLASLKRGDRIITAGGIHGRILEVNDDTVVVDLGNSSVTISRNFISAVAPATPNKQAKPNKGKKGKDDKQDKNQDKNADQPADNGDENDADVEDAETEEKK